MIMANTMAIFLFIVGLLIVFPAHWLLCRALLPRWVEGSETMCREHPFASTFLGLFLGGGVVLVAVVLGSVGGQAGAGILVSLLYLYGMIGAAGLASHVGARLASPADAGRPWRATVRGGIVLELPFLFPVIGWFVLTSLVLAAGTGAATLALFSRLFGTPPRPAADVPAARSEPFVREATSIPAGVGA